MADTPDPNPKRSCCISTDPSKHPFNHMLHLDQADSLLKSFLGLSNSALDRSFNRLLDSCPGPTDQGDTIECALRLGSALLEAGKRASRGLASDHNAAIWALSSDLTIKVFSLLDTQSVCYAAATCSFFHKCAADPACYANIDLVTMVPKVNNLIVATMIQRAGKAFRSLKLGVAPTPLTAASGSSQPLVCSIRNSVDSAGFSWNDKKSRQGKESFFLTRSCLAPLSSNGGTTGSYMKRLHLYNIERLDDAALYVALSVCSSLRDVELVGLNVDLSLTIGSISTSCPLIERLFLESSKAGRDCSLKLQLCCDLSSNCPNLSSLTLRGFKLHDSRVCVLVKGLRKLKHVDFSTSYSVTGTFLKNLGGNAGGNLLEALILKDCVHLKEVEVARFLSAVLAGNFSHLKHLDISNREGLASEGDWYRRCCSKSFIPFKQLLEARPGLCVLSEFPQEPCCGELVSSSESSDLNSTSSLLSIYASDELAFMSSPEMIYHISDPGGSSGNDNSQETAFAMGEESWDEVDFTPDTHF
ncbi:unnamed protein product [Cuscuta epithymum]|uniref:F-box protein n=1 Tax=Cuscuta epithymum TaxID=186058 RepID=A0AAV0CL13_9ASTE|nr:unnamed protein product [Cuscuta epithymum]CAH9127279.1 unnamed protein product [Cuscuta epithymum]